ncbi:MAG: energy transducer TonB [Proteobacteria bacterium]|nr:energy transducer TonB [Pseudomonadota bacterium]
MTVLQDTPRRTGHAAIDWDSTASRTAIAGLLEARRTAALMDELVIKSPSRPRNGGRPAAAPRAPPPNPQPERSPVARTDVSPPRPEHAAPPLPAPPVEPPPAEPTVAAAPAPPPPVPPTPVVGAAEPLKTAPEPPPRAEAVRPPVPLPAPGVNAGARPPESAVAAVAPPPRAVTDPNYLEAVLKRLRRIKDYPVHTSGRVFVAFTVARDGTVLNAEVRRSSGHSALDQAGLDLIRRASPLPPLPASVPGDSYAIEIPISFLYD